MIAVSIIIPTYNRSTLLERALRSIINQTYPPDKFEVVIIDNGSTDRTKEVTAAFTGQIRNLKYIFLEKPGLHHGRHAGMNSSSGSILVFADDDIEALPTWLDGITESFQDPHVALVGGKNIPTYETTPPPWIEKLREKSDHGWHLTYYSLLDLGNETKEIDPRFVFGCNFAIRKDVLLKIGGFHPDAMPQSLLKFRGDGETHVSEQIQKLNYIAFYNPKASVKHWVPTSRMNMDYLKKRSFAEGISKSYSDTRKNLNSPEENLAIRILKKLKKLIRFIFSNPMQRTLAKSFDEGYTFHQSELKKDKDLVAWVNKENYLD